LTNTDRTKESSHPYTSPGTPIYETVTYDGIDRPLTTTHPDGSYVTSAYAANVTSNGGIATQLCSTSTYGYGYPSISLDETGKKRQTWTDAFGRTIEVDEPNSSGNLTVDTCYVYNITDKLVDVSQGSEVRTFTYDGLNRLTKEVTPEAGTVTLSYTNSGGGLCSGNPEDVCGRTEGAQNQTNQAVTVTTTYCYDSLNRRTAKGYSSTIQSCPMSSPAVTYTYDQGGAGAFAEGRLTTLSDSSGTETYIYDANGRVTQLQKTISGTAYNISYSYNVADKVTQVTYPSGRQIQNGYDAVGNALSVSSGSTTYLSIPATNGYTAIGQPLTFTYGNAVTANFSYSSNRSQLTSLAYANSSSPLFGLNYFYSYDQNSCASGTTKNNGQIDCIIDNVQPGRNIDYTYDPLRRLSSAVTTGSSAYPQWGVSETYDQYGNRPTQTVTAGTAPGVSLTFTASNRPSGYTYDASGNLTVEPLNPPNNYSYDPENRLTSFSGNGGNASYAYDDNDHRVIKQIQGGTSTVYIFSGDTVLAEYDNGAPPTSPSREYIYFDAGPSPNLEPQLIAKIEGGTTQYYHQDHLSIRLLTDSNGNKVAEQGHYPFGEEWYPSIAATKWMLTTYERDLDTGNNSGLDYALARFYDSRVGSFCSADPVEGVPEDPQSWNRYSYVRDDPINKVDPNGQFLDFLSSVVTWLTNLLGIGSANVFGTPSSVQTETSINLIGSTSATILYNGNVVGTGSSPFFEVVTKTVTTTGTTTGFTADNLLGRTLANLGASAANGNGAKKKDCPPVPVHPPNVDVDNNIDWAENPSYGSNDPNAIAGGFEAHVGAWFDRICCDSSQWNYKAWSPRGKYDAFGNFNFGATGAALGIPQSILLRGAGLAKFFNVHPLGKFGNPLGQWPYGNQREKQQAIEDGIRYFKNNCMHGG
jgi:RHS repeat-associated protein